MKLANMIADMPEELWRRLQSQTEDAVTCVNPAEFAYFKFAYQDSLVTPSWVLTEYHLTVDWEAPGHVVRDKLRTAIHNLPAQAPINISFASRPLEGNQSLADIGAAYGDKIYFNVGDPRGGQGGPSSLAVWSRYFNRVGTAVKRDPHAYEDLVDATCRHFDGHPDVEQWSGQDWAQLLLVRHLPGVYASVATGQSVLQTTERLIQVLQSASEDHRAATVYHAANILEWLAYLKPRMFEGADLLRGREARKALAHALLHAVDPATNLPGRVRMESAWAISWASVASEDFGHEVYEHLVDYEKMEKPSPIVMTLRSAAVRSLLYPTPYFIAAVSPQAGWFQASVRDQHEFRRIAVSDRHDEALKRFQAELASVLPRIQAKEDRS